MTEIAEQPKFQWGQPVAASIDLFNDGTFPGEAEGALLVKAGDKGEIVQIGARYGNRRACLPRRVYGEAGCRLPRRRIHSFEE